MPCFLSVSRHLFFPLFGISLCSPIPDHCLSLPSDFLSSVHALLSGSAVALFLASAGQMHEACGCLLKRTLCLLRSAALQERGKLEGTKEMKGPQVWAVPRGLTTSSPVRSHSTGKPVPCLLMSKRLFASESLLPFPWEQAFTDHFQRIGHNEINHKVTGAAL